MNCTNENMNHGERSYNLELASSFQTKVPTNTELNPLLVRLRIRDTTSNSESDVEEGQLQNHKVTMSLIREGAKQHPTFMEQLSKSRQALDQRVGIFARFANISIGSPGKYSMKFTLGVSSTGVEKILATLTADGIITVVQGNSDPEPGLSSRYAGKSGPFILLVFN